MTPVDLLREAATKIRVDVKIAVDRGHMAPRIGVYNRAVADLLSQQAEMYEAHPQTWPIRKAVAVARSYLGRDA